jgi:hypothetical protein
MGALCHRERQAFLDTPQQSAFYPYPHNSQQFGPYVNGFGQAWADMGHDPLNQFSKGYPYGMQQKGSNGASGYDGSLDYTLNTRNVSGREQHQVRVMYPQTVTNVGFLYPQSATRGASLHSQVHGTQTKGPKGAFFDE